MKSPAVPPTPSALLRALADATRAHPLARKRLVGPDVNFGREALTALARLTGGWIGWEATSLRDLAGELAFVPLADRGLRAATDIEIAALVNRALDEAVAAGTVSGRFAALARGLGFRRALRDSLLECRMAGVSGDAIRRGAEPESPAADLPAVLDGYAKALGAAGLADPAAIFHAALDGFDAEAPFVLDGLTFLAPAPTPRGLPARLLERLREHGARTLAEASRAEDAPLTDLFAAASPSDELREVCRRVLAEGLRWDEVEVVATDPDAYGIALDALCQRTGLGATMLCGVPLARTRLGRALDRWLAWLEDGLPATTLRQALEAGELRAPERAGAERRRGQLPSTLLARELRTLGIGWGRARYEAALAPLDDGRAARELAQGEDEPDDVFAERRESRRRSAAALAALLRALLEATPRVPERGSARAVRSSAAALARATLTWLQLVPIHGMAERQTAIRLSTRLTRLAELDAATGLREELVPFPAALAALRDALADLRAWPLVTSERKPWSAAGGMLHLGDVAHAGVTGRPRIFVVGLDADRAGSSGRQDPLLPDLARRAIAPGALPTSAERRDESAAALAAALAGLTGRVTLSYATGGSLDGRESGPAPALLQAWRDATGDAAFGYEELRRAVLPPVSAVPGPAVQRLDARDVWLDALADGPLLLDGDALVRAAFPMLDAGLRAAEASAGPVPTAHHGLVPGAAGKLDPSRRGREISPSALEQLAKCPLAWFYRYGLRLWLPQDPEYDPESWLDALQRGSLLHEVYETFAREYQGRQEEIAGEEARRRILAIAREAVARWRETVPPPGEAVFADEARRLEEDAIAFLEMERAQLAAGDGGRWARLELGFGAGEPAGAYTLGSGQRLAIKGRADRIDALPDGTLRVVDYKTGRAAFYQKRTKSGPFNGGRHLQPALYVAALGPLLDRPVSRFEFRFPTARGENAIVAYDRAELEAARPVVDGLLEHVRQGAFIPTTERGDCGYCEYKPVCRVKTGEYESESPRADWAAEHAETIALYRPMLARRARATP